jgi:hypothetical protein
MKGGAAGRNRGAFGSEKSVLHKIKRIWAAKNISIPGRGTGCKPPGVIPENGITPKEKGGRRI